MLFLLFVFFVFPLTISDSAVVAICTVTIEWNNITVRNLNETTVVVFAYYYDDVF